MKIIDTFPYFVHNYQPSLSFLRTYYAHYEKIFNAYFSRHCKDTEERHLQSLQKYPEYFPNIEKVHDHIRPIIEEIAEAYYNMYQITFPVEVNLIVGGFGSNAYIYHHQGTTQITFALETLSPAPDHLKVIVAHEFGHAAHHFISNNAKIDWSKIQWDSPLIWLYQEGAAIHFSRRIVSHLEPFVYYSYNEEGREWLAYAESNIKEIKKAFAEDYSGTSSDQLYREWFSINGGKKFGYTRLGYYLGDLFLQDRILKLGERNALLSWIDADFVEEVRQWLFRK